MMYRSNNFVHGLAPSYLADMFTEQVGSKIYDLRNSKFNLEIPTAQNLNVQEQFCIHGCMDLECTSRTCERAAIHWCV